MNINPSVLNGAYQGVASNKEATQPKRLSEETVADIRIEIRSYQITVAKASLESFGAQQPKSFEDQYAEFEKMLDDIGYDGLPIAELTPEEAEALVADDGIFGIAKTSERLSQFVLMGAGDDIDMLRAGRVGILEGYNQAQELWGGELPEISQLTLQKALEQIDAKMAALGYSAVDLEA